MDTRVSDIMTTDVVTCDVETSLESAAETMLRNGVGSVIITNEETPYGIVTETDIVFAGYHSGCPLESIPTRKAASHRD